MHLLVALLWSLCTSDISKFWIFFNFFTFFQTTIDIPEEPSDYNVSNVLLPKVWALDFRMSVSGWCFHMVWWLSTKWGELVSIQFAFFLHSENLICNVFFLFILLLSSFNGLQVIFETLLGPKITNVTPWSLFLCFSESGVFRIFV